MKEKQSKKGHSPKNSYSKERAAFKMMLLGNPNYFGNLCDSPLKPVLSISGNTYYEELGCVGYHPQQKNLEAVVYVYQPSGYGSDICGMGSSEFVRFYLSFDNGATWNDEGMTSFQVHNIPEGTEKNKRLEYAVSLPTRIRSKVCTVENLIQVRAILSWNNPPPANQPNWTPIWGNVQEATIQVEPRRFWFPIDIFSDLKIKNTLLDIIDPDISIPTKQTNLDAVALSKVYKDTKIPVHRFAYKELSKFVSNQINFSAESFVSLLPGIKIDPKITDLLFPEKDGNTSYEELKCIGLDPNSPNSLVGIIHVKKSSGYSGDVCTNGSREYVTFWADFDDNGSFETCLGTASVRAYDLDNISADGVYYSVRLPVDLSDYRQRCLDGAKVVRVRAILSWNVTPPCNNPNYVPVWGNREETIINISPLAGVPAGKIAILGGIPTSMINNANGKTTPDAIFATNNLPPDSLGRACSFGGRITLQGAPISGYSYKVEVTPESGGTPIPVVTDLVLTRADGTTLDHTANVVTGRFDYVSFESNINGLLAQWDSTSDDRWVVKLSSFDAGGNLAGVDTQLIQLDNTWPDVSIEITSGTGDCGKFHTGELISGNFVVRDDNLANYSLRVEPAVNPAGTSIPVPNSGLVNTAVAPGDIWELDTTGMRACGYIIRVTGKDLAIVNSQSPGHYKNDSAGFCLEES